MTYADVLKPSYCVWELTLACNQRCGHCGSKAGIPRPDELDTAECLQVVQSLAKLGCEVITLSGGEPTLRSDWHRIAREIRHQGMIPNMVSNGYAMDKTLAAQMKDAGLANVAISIDGPEEIHEQIRGKGSFARTVHAIELLKNVEMPVTIMTTVNALNLHRLDDIYAVACALEVDRWRCQLGKAMGHMKTNSELIIRPKDLLILLPKLYALNETGPVKVGIGDSIGYFGPYDSQLRAVSWKGTRQRWGGCQAGLYAIGVESNGGIKGCLSMQAFRGNDDSFLEGNIRNRSLESIWKDPTAFAYNRNFSEESLTGACRKCTHRAVCRGGAKCVAATATQSLSEDPYCYYRVANTATRWPRVLRRTAATASLVCLMGAGPCEVDPAAPDSGALPQLCEDMDCADPATTEEERMLCCPAPEYGVEPACEAVDCGDPNLSADLAEQCCGISPDYGVEPIPCKEVCCECEYGVIPEEVYQECCAEPIDCNEVCCECDYGVIPEEAYLECCSPALEYGVEPVSKDLDTGD
jgi:MoaA/NifB/PqqE/SkfB family radical SAM enzyme